jgi:hypothetical protein
MKYEIELPDVLKLDGVKYEPTGEFREPKHKEVFINVLGEVEEANHSFSGDKRIILRPVWTWPEELKGWGIVKSKDSKELFWFEACPVRDSVCWVPAWKTESVRLAVLCEAIGFTPPVITDWTKPIVNPNWKGEVAP